MKTTHYATKVVMFSGRRYGYPVPIAQTVCGQKGTSTTSRVAFITSAVPCDACRQRLKTKIP